MMTRLVDSVLVSTFELDLTSKAYTNRLLGARDFSEKYNLEKEVLYDVALDQSNTCTGVTIRDVRENRLLIMEIINNGVNFESYRGVLVTLLERLLVGNNVRYMIMEEPLGYITGRRNKELTKLKHTLIDFVKETRGLCITKFDTVAPQSWRAGIIQKDNPEPKNSKLACVHEVIKMYPETATMRSHKKIGGADYDGFESCGILCGYIDRHAITNTSDLTKIIGKKNSTKVAFAMFIKPSGDATVLTILLELIKGTFVKLNSPVVKYYDDKSSVYENVKMSLEDDVTVTVVTAELANLSIRHLFKLPTGEGNFYLVVIPGSVVTSNFISALDNLDVDWEIFY